MVTRTGIIGVSDGNGHPFSFSAIINGFDRCAFANAGWPVILEYLQEQPTNMFGVGDAKVTCAWTQDRNVTELLCTACGIETRADDPYEMLEQVDAVIIARDDWQCHAELAMPFLESGIPVFVDKPLSLNRSELEAFRPYLEAGLLMSTSGMRYAIEVEDIYSRMDEVGEIQFICATVVNDVERYGIHMLDALGGLEISHPILISRADTQHQSYDIRFKNGVELRLDCLGSVGKTFHLSIFGSKGHIHTDLHNNFMAFRRTLERFFTMVHDRKPPVDPDIVIGTMNLIRQAAKMVPSRMVEVLND